MASHKRTTFVHLIIKQISLYRAPGIFQVHTHMCTDVRLKDSHFTKYGTILYGNECNCNLDMGTKLPISSAYFIPFDHILPDETHSFPHIYNLWKSIKNSHHLIFCGIIITYKVCFSCYGLVQKLSMGVCHIKIQHTENIYVKQKCILIHILCYSIVYLLVTTVANNEQLSLRVL